MPENQETSGGSFARAFVPGLIFGLVVGALAGAFLPDFIGGSNIPAPDTEAVAAPHAAEGPRDPIDPADAQAADQAVRDAVDAAEQGARPDAEQPDPSTPNP